MIEQEQRGDFDPKDYVLVILTETVTHTELKSWDVK
jgi:hypothetical protein